MHQKITQSPNCLLNRLRSHKTPKMTNSSPMVSAKGKGPRMSPAIIGISSPKLSPVVGSVVRRSNLTPDYAVAPAEDCKTPESTRRRPLYSPKTRRRLRLTFDFAQRGDEGDGGGEEADEGEVVDLGKI